MTEIIFLGVGGAMPSEPADNHTALVVEQDPVRILLDAGPGIMRQLECAGLNAGDPTHVYVSHRHGDHTLGFPMLLLNRVLFWPERALVVMGTTQVLAVLEQVTSLVYPDLAARMRSVVKLCPLDRDATAVPIPGTDGMRCSLAPGWHSVHTWGIRLDLRNGTSLVYSSDTGPSADMARLAAGVDLLVHESFYLEPDGANQGFHSWVDDVAVMAAGAEVGTLALVHRELTEAEAVPQYLAAARRHFAGPVLVPQPGDRYVF